MQFINRFRWLTLFVLFGLFSTLISLTIYASVQQVYRTNANDPQVEISEAISDALDQGAPPEAIAGQNGPVDMAKSLSVFFMIFDKDAKVLAGVGKLDGKDQNPPAGVFDVAKKKTDYRFTWQPKKGVRIAAVLRKAGGDKGFILVGRSLREVEKQEQNLLYMVAIAWVGMLGLSALLAWVIKKGSGNVAIVEENIVVEVAPEAPTENIE